MKTYNFSLASATDTVVFDTLVRVIRYDEGSGTGTPSIRIKSLSDGSFDVEMKPGKVLKLPDIVRGLVITNLTAGAITGKITIGAGDITDNNLSGTVTLDAAALAALESVDLNAATLATMRQPLAGTNSYSQSGAMTANTAVQVFAPAANVNGAILLGASISGYSSEVSLLAKTSAPANDGDGDLMLRSLIRSYSTGSASNFYSDSCYMPQLVDAGKGLYFITPLGVSACARGARVRFL